MKLELKHLAPYLPYALQIMGLSEPNSKEPNIITMNCDFCQQVINGYFKPILRPLSDLTKEIEVNGEKFVPIEELAKILKLTGNLSPIEDDENKNCFAWDVSYGDDAQGYAICWNENIKWFACCYYEDILDNCISSNNPLYPFEFDYSALEKLFEWHFDFQNLIEQGLAIDINTLK